MAKIHDAAAKGDVAQVTALLDSGMDVNTKTWFTGNTPLNLAVGNGHAEVVALLLNRGAKGNHDELIVTALQKGRDDLVMLMVDHGCGSLKDALHFAVHMQKPKLTAVLLDRGAKADGKNTKGLTLLMQAAVDKNTEIVRLLLDHGAHVNASTSDGATPLHLAFTPNGMTPTRELIELLLERGANVNARMKGTAMTPLWSAWTVDDRKLRLELMRLLLKNGAHVGARYVNTMRVLAERISTGEVDAATLQGKTLLETIMQQEPDDTALLNLLQNWKPNASALPLGEAKPVQPPPVPQISFRCGSCSNPLKAPIQAAGKTTKCPKCSKPIVIPSS